LPEHEVLIENDLIIQKVNLNRYNLNHVNYASQNSGSYSLPK